MSEYAKPEDWRSSAACGNEDPELFFPVGSSGPAKIQEESAKAVCRNCIVAEPCLDWALESGQDSGVWGGYSEDERRALKRRGGRLIGAQALQTAVENPQVSTSGNTDVSPLPLNVQQVA